MSAAPFYRCPPELCERIFTLACLDDGTTGRSLSLVSKYISDTSKSIKLQSLAVRNLYQAEGLASMLKKLSFNERRVVHLFVVCDYPQIYTDLVTNGDISTAGQEQSAWDRVRSRLSLDESPYRCPYPVYPMVEELYTLAIIRILILVSPTLRSLSISISTCGLWIGLHGVPELPLLEELTLSYKTEHNEKLTARLLHSFRYLPALRYLDLSQFSDSGCRAHSLVAQIRRMAPSLTTLRIPYALNQNPHSYDRHEQPRVQVGWNGWLKKGEKDTNLDENLREGNSEARNRKTRLPTTVQKIVVALPDKDEHRNEEIVEECRNLARKDKMIICMTPEPVPRDFVGDRLEMEWLERINDRHWRNVGDVRSWESPNIARPSSAAVPTPTQVAFPPELVDAIIDQIHLDVVYHDTDQYQAAQRSRKRALDACSLVSKSWLPRSRSHLFQSITLLRELVRESLTFVALLHAPLSTIAPYVQELCLNEARGRYKSEVRWLNAALPRLTVLSAIMSLVVDAARFDVLEIEDTTSFFGSFQMLRKLDLSDCTFATSEQLIEVLGAIPSLEYLRLYKVTISPKWNIDDLFDILCLEAGRYPREAFDLSSYSSTPSRLHTLVFSHAFAVREVLQWLVKNTPVPPIQTLQLYIHQIEDLQHVAEFLQVLGPSVTNLTMSDSSYSQECRGAYYFLSSACHFIFFPHCATCRCIFSLR